MKYVTWAVYIVWNLIRAAYRYVFGVPEPVRLAHLHADKIAREMGLTYDHPWRESESLRKRLLSVADKGK